MALLILNVIVLVGILREWNKLECQQKQLIREVEQVTERLTEDYFDDMQKITRHYAKSNNIDLNTGGNDFQDIIDKLAEYETAEEEGRLKVLPCKVGDIIFCIVRPGIIRQFKVLSIEIYEYGAILELLYAGNVEKYRFWRIYMPSDDFGSKLFLTSEEAEEALKEMKK